MSLAFLWIWTGIVSLGLYPISDSLALLAPLGLSDGMGRALILGGGGLDLLLGILVLARWRVPWVSAAQLALMAAYTGLVTIFMPELWLHPLGAMSKNVPVAAATLALMALEAKRG
ncbi:MAG: DoxX-like family protein [Elstera sp.]